MKKSWFMRRFILGVLNINFFELAKQSLNNVHEFLLSYNSLRMGLQTDFTTLSNKYDQINYKEDAFFKSTVPKLIDFSKDVLDSIKKYSTKTYDLINRKKTQKAKNSENLLETKLNNSSLENIVDNNKFKTYTSSLNNIKKNDKYKDISNILLGEAYTKNNKRAWSWIDRESLLDKYIINNNSDYEDKENMTKLKQALRKNKYLRYRKKETYKRIKEKLKKLNNEKSPNS